MLPISWLDAEKPHAVVAEATEGTTWAPKVAGEAPAARVALPRVAAYRYRQALVHAHSSAIALADRLVVERVPGLPPTRGDHHTPLVEAHFERLGIVRPMPTESLVRGIFLGGNGAFNYYHWLVEVLPKLGAVEELAELREWPLLIPASTLTTPNLMAALARVCRGRQYQVLDADRAYAVDDLVYVSSASICPFNLRSGHTTAVADYRLAPSTVEFWRDVRTGSGVSDSPRRVFLARRPGLRSYNQDEVEVALARRGFETVYAEELRFSDQIALAAGAEVLVGPSGAAWTNLLFATAGATAVSWLPEPCREFSAYSTLARMVGVDLEVVLHPTEARTSGEMYSAGYQLDIDMVQAALDRAIG